MKEFSITNITLFLQLSLPRFWGCNIEIGGANESCSRKLRLAKLCSGVRWDTEIFLSTSRRNWNCPSTLPQGNISWVALGCFNRFIKLTESSNEKPWCYEWAFSTLSQHKPTLSESDSLGSRKLSQGPWQKVPEYHNLNPGPQKKLLWLWAVAHVQWGMVLVSNYNHL